MTDSTPQPMTEEESAAWVREQWQHANMFLAEKGVIPSTLNHKESRYLIPVLALWKITGEDNKTYWVINGELPTDFMLVENAPDARDAMRHFALKWQVQAANTLENSESSAQQRSQADFLQNRAESLYRFYEDESLWVS
ncbi:DUF4826 family protein [Alteromonas confluentis]|uniref:DUF4826 domain-containing protein n=1 Tax=Alteromonas confluentis TaxID=1656094 RepID=A0A1E7Z960_9ALTE|nr:DUF4826 family protein [Alteromonas confluentis]OFC70060.1 hypothetical protein BFC18_15105 [Alteromonas confluentis]